MKTPFGKKATINPRTISDSPDAFQRRRGGARDLASFFLLATLSGLPSVAGATTAAQLCPGDADPCVVNKEVAIDPDSIIALGERGLRLTGAGRLRIQSGSLSLRCGVLTIDAGASIRSTGSRRDLPAASVEIEALSIHLAGRIDARGSPAGSVTLTAADSILLSGEILGRAEASDAGAARVELSAAAVTISGEINLGGGGDDVGGDLTVAADSSLIVSGSAALDVSGGEGGAIDLSSEGSLVIDRGAALHADGRTIAEDGGSVSIAATGPLTMHGVISATARAGDEENGAGDGGAVSIGSDSDVDLFDGATSIDVSGGSPDGIGGDIEIESSFASLRSAAALAASVAASDGLGGSITVSAGTQLLFLGSAETRGGNTGGGEIDIDADADLSIGNGAVLDASAVRAGAGGSVDLTAGTEVTMAGTVHADGGNSEGSSGGKVTVRACAILVPASGTITAVKTGGRNSLTSRARCEIAGALRAEPSGGVNELRFRAAGEEPITTGADIVPAPQLIVDGTLAPCGPLPPTATPTPTVAADSPTPTATPLACPGDCDGTVRVDIAELVRAVNIALGRAPLSTCHAADRDGNGNVGINELIAAVAAALQGCRS